MNFKHYIKLREEPLPEVGMYRQHRNPERTRENYKKVKQQRDLHCFNHQLNLRCKTYQAYKRECYKIKQIDHILNIVLPNDVVNYLWDFYKIDQLHFIPMMGYHIIQKKNDYKWYILISNILYTMKEPYHQNVLELHKDLDPIDYHNTFNLLMKGIGAQSNILTKGIHFKCDSNSIFDIAFEYKKYLNDRLYYLYLNIRL